MARASKPSTSRYVVIFLFIYFIISLLVFPVPLFLLFFLSTSPTDPKLLHLAVMFITFLVDITISVAIAFSGDTRSSLFLNKNPFLVKNLKCCQKLPQ